MAIRKWYVLHVYSQHEDKVKANIEKMAANNGLQNEIKEVYLPKKIVEEKDNKGKIKEKLKIVTPGYLYINVDLTDNIWHLIKGIDGVTGFLGDKPRPLRRGEVENIKSSLEDAPVVRSSAWKKGDQVIIKKGSFTDFEGVVIEVSDNNVTVETEIFNKKTPVKLDFIDIESI